ncbi:MAG TPA: adenine phosphoribosyltransferase, partial [Gaiellaceae bacterium]|nr:adenine phosphoribosyltransferase [Gaiellaceae bacterium]
MIDLKTRIREVPDFPEPGVGFKDISPLLLDPAALKQAVGELAAWTAEREPDLVLGAEARGFWLGAAVACEVGCGFVAARRPGKLPPETVTAKYMLEYGENALEVNADAISRGARVVIHDDVLATG